MSSHLDNFNTCNKVLTAKLLRQEYRYHKLRKAFSTLHLQGLSKPELYGNLVYKFRKIFVFKYDFPYHFKKIIVRYKKIGYNIDVYDRLHAWLLIQSRLTTLLTSLIARR